MLPSGKPKLNAWNKAAAAQQEQQHQRAADVHVTLTDKAITNCLAMSEREKENQHRWLKMQAKHAAIQVILETLIIETNRGGSHPTPTKCVGRSAGGGRSEGITISFRQLNWQRWSSKPTEKDHIQRRQSMWGEAWGREARSYRPPINKPETGLFLGE